MKKHQHKCINIDSELLPNKFLVIYTKLKVLSDDFTLDTTKITDVLDEFYEKVFKWVSYAIKTHEHFNFPTSPLSMQGDSATVRKANGEEKNLYPKNKRDFKMIEFAREIKSPFKFTLISNLAIYYSTKSGQKLNKNVSEHFKIEFYGDVIIVPQDLMPKL